MSAAGKIDERRRAAYFTRYAPPYQRWYVRSKPKMPDKLIHNIQSFVIHIASHRVCHIVTGLTFKGSHWIFAKWNFLSGKSLVGGFGVQIARIYRRVFLRWRYWLLKSANGSFFGGKIIGTHCIFANWNFSAVKRSNREFLGPNRSNLLTNFSSDAHQLALQCDYLTSYFFF